MLHVVNTIGPIFIVILLGWFLNWRSFIPSGLIAPLNRLVYYLAIPAMIFSGVAKSSFAVHFDPFLLAATLLPVLVVFLIALVTGTVCPLDRHQRGTFIQSSFHGNLGYIGLAVCYYLLGEKGLTSASILAGFLMLFQNLLAVIGYQLVSSSMGKGRRLWFFIKKIGGNPVIGSSLAGMAFSLLKIPIPETIDRCLTIISGMALPSALLVIGASLSFGLIRAYIRLVLAAGLLKLLVLPALGVLAYRLSDIHPAQFLPGLILLAAPTATITFVMAGEMDGSTDLATAAISMITLLSALTFILWLWQFS
ncbi:MAG: AEC family transporter [Desulfobacteraceae bacterium]|nr:AEC family transporter [Desulfobacteraceae bacterium]MBL7172240.1 AEC family transporter [Desulfobacteraceae bacterium]MBU0990366.1 AEC family transporter [Pseudomonadota bacterium]